MSDHIDLQKCNLCGSTSHHKRFYKAPFTRLQCDNCGLVWSQEQPNFAELTALYGSDYFNGATYLNYVVDQPVIELNARKRLKSLQQYIDQPGTVIEVGCATGFFLDVCRSAGWTAKGVELSDYASQYAREQLKLDVITGTLADANYAPGSARLVALWDVIEHVPDPMETLSESAKLVEPNGLLALSTGDIESLISRLLGPSWRLITYDHLYYFSAATMRKYMEKVGLEVIKIVYPGRLVSPTLVTHMLLNHYLRIPALRNPLLKFAGILPDISLNFYDVMTVYARKR